MACCRESAVTVSQELCLWFMGQASCGPAGGCRSRSQGLGVLPWGQVGQRWVLYWRRNENLNSGGTMLAFVHSVEVPGSLIFVFVIFHNLNFRVKGTFPSNIIVTQPWKFSLTWEFTVLGHLRPGQNLKINPICREISRNVIWKWLLRSKVF